MRSSVTAKLSSQRNSALPLNNSLLLRLYVHFLWLFLIAAGAFKEQRFCQETTVRLQFAFDDRRRCALESCLDGAQKRQSAVGLPAFVGNLNLSVTACAFQSSLPATTLPFTRTRCP